MQANTMQVRTVKNSFFTLSTWSKQWCFQCIYAYFAHDDGYSYILYLCQSCQLFKLDIAQIQVISYLLEVIIGIHWRCGRLQYSILTQ